MDTGQLRELLQKYLNSVLTKQEFELLQQHKDHPDLEAVLAELVPQSYFDKKDNSSALNESEQVFLARIFQSDRQPAPIVEMTPRRKRRWPRIAAAAAILVLLAGGSVFFLRSNKDRQNFAGLPQAERFKNDINPAAEGVTLTTGSGETIRLDSAVNKRLLTDGSVNVINGDGSVAYTDAGQAVFYHTISTNKGRDYQLTLADGSKVWLDALSSIHFPTAFPGNERVVEVTGQAYFEVAKDPSRPFRVKINDQLVEVLGTHFNVNGHEGMTKTTLLEGSVKASIPNGNPVLLHPGQQAVSGNGSMKAVASVDMEEVMAWKNGQFYFDGATIEDIMKQLSRWYDINVAYQGNVKEIFVATMPRQLPVSKLLTLLEKTKLVEFAIDGNKVTVLAVK